MTDIQPKLPDSPIIQILSTIWKHGIGSGSWIRFNQHLRSTLFDAIEGGVEFQEGDFAEMEKRFRLCYWIGDEGIEYAYRTAICYDNDSCWKTIEAARKRKPFIATNVSYSGRGLRHSLPEKVRLAVGFGFAWNGEKVTVTSFDDEKGALIACSYEMSEQSVCDKCKHITSWPQKVKILHRYTITNADWLKGRKK